MNISVDYIKNIISDRIPKPIDVKRNYAVLIPLIENNNQLEIIYELRSENLRQQPGEISFPGGSLEAGETFQEAAIRETMEELNLKRENIELIGEIDYLVSYANITIHCFVGRIVNIDFKDINYSRDEVAELFTVPLSYFMENTPDTYYLDLETVLNDEFPYNLIPNGKEYNWRRGKHSVMFYNYDKYTIWGFTARMTKSFIDIIKESSL